VIVTPVATSDVIRRENVVIVTLFSPDIRCAAIRLRASHSTVLSEQGILVVSTCFCSALFVLFFAFREFCQCVRLSSAFSLASRAARSASQFALHSFHGARPRTALTILGFGSLFFGSRRRVSCDSCAVRAFSTLWAGARALSVPIAFTGRSARSARRRGVSLALCLTCLAC
jgi:hypothetical protein